MQEQNHKKEVYKTIFGLLLLAFSIVMVIAFVSYYSYGFEDQSQIANILDREDVTHNALAKLGNYLGYFFIFMSLGVAAFLVPFFLFLYALKILLNREIIKIWKTLSHSLFFLVWLPVTLSFLFPYNNLLTSVMGIEVSEFIVNYIGKIGTGIVLFLALLIYFVLEFDLTAEKVRNSAKNLKEKITEIDTNSDEKNQTFDFDDDLGKTDFYTEKQDIPFLVEEGKDEESESTSNQEEASKEIQISNNLQHTTTLIVEPPKIEEEEQQITALEITEIKKEITQENPTTNIPIKELSPYDPRLDLPDFTFPSIQMLKAYNDENITIDNQELEQNKNRIVETLGNYGIGISQIKATIGPTVTLYEIVPDAGVRISKIKNLEDDIALSLAALGIRIIAPIPGKGTIGIEVPNSNPTIVSMRSVIASQRFQSAKMELPIAFGKTISNETLVVDLAKMPHLLMAGATGQGKSVGLNAVIASLLFKKHPNELKFVFVDPKKVELTLYNKIERHYLAMLPNTEDAIITDTSKVVYTLNSLCVEMDFRYELLKVALVRNIKEYNEKFIQRKLNPEHGHRFLPYIVLIIDEFADLIMTAGKEVETPIARLAQLARAVGIHLIIATQRPSVNVITGIIKANFPARVAFRVTSKIDSRTILDGQGADQLIGKGDMLLTTGNDVIRLQCAFVDTPEIETITEFIGSQKAPIEPYYLPEYVNEENANAKGVDLSDRDELFEEAARVLIIAQQGSTSLIQRKLSLGYNRAGRIMDQLEAAGIVGPFEGSKARKVLFSDLASLEQFLQNM